MSRATFDELKAMRRRAKEISDAEMGAAAAWELVERRGSFEDLCWLAWFQRDLGRISAARLTILEALAENPGHPSALAFLQELECAGAAKVSSLVAQSPSPSQPSIEESTPQSEPVDTTPVREVVADRALLEHQTATAANRHDWRQVVRLAEELLSMDRKIEYSCWLIRAQVE